MCHFHSARAIYPFTTGTPVAVLCLTHIYVLLCGTTSPFLSKAMGPETPVSSSNSSSNTIATVSLRCQQLGSRSTSSGCSPELGMPPAAPVSSLWLHVLSTCKAALYRQRVPRPPTECCWDRQHPNPTHLRSLSPSARPPAVARPWEALLPRTLSAAQPWRRSPEQQSCRTRHLGRQTGSAG